MLAIIEIQTFGGKGNQENDIMSYSKQICFEKLIFNCITSQKQELKYAGRRKNQQKRSKKPIFT